MSDARETPAAQPPKKRMSSGTRVLVIIVCILLAIALILVGTVLILSAVGRNALTNDDGVNIARDDVEALGSGTVRYNGQLYRYNTDIVTILLMGVDEEVKQDADGVYGNANQSDANILAVLDMRNQELTLVSISRDAMCTLDILDSTGAHVGTATAQLALAYSYGDGAERSCELTSAAVSRLFYDLPIPAYGSIYMQGIRQLVDSVGGVTVTPDASFSGFTAGQPVTLTGQRTENYIRYRADSTEGNNQRMQRQHAEDVRERQAHVRAPGRELHGRARGYIRHGHAEPVEHAGLGQARVDGAGAPRADPAGGSFGIVHGKTSENARICSYNRMVFRKSQP